MSNKKVATNANSTTIEALQSKISVNHTKGLENEKLANSHLAQSVINYRDCGFDIIILKDECKAQGIPYIPELEKTGIKERMGQRCMQLARHERTKDVDVDFFANMQNPVLLNVIKALSLSDDDWNKVIHGDNSPLEIKKVVIGNNSDNENSDTEISQNNDISENFTPADNESDVVDANSSSTDKGLTPDKEDEPQDTSNIPDNADEPASNNVVDGEPAQEEIDNKYPDIFSDDEYKSIINSTKEFIIELLVNEKIKYNELHSTYTASKVVNNPEHSLNIEEVA
jgi:hypothetical protein